MSLRLSGPISSKDLRIEWRSKDAINSMLFFALLVVVLFSMSFDPRGAVCAQIAGGVLCVATMFASVSALNQAWAREIRHQVMDAQRMTPAPASAAVSRQGHRQFHLRHHRADCCWRPSSSCSTTCTRRDRAGCWRWCCRWAHGRWWCNGTFFAALAIRSRNRELLLPLILFPIFLPACWRWCRPQPRSSPGESDPGLWIKLWRATTLFSPP